MSNNEEEELEISNIIPIIKRAYNKLTVKDLIIIGLVLMLMLIYIIHVQNITNCNLYYQEILKERANPVKSLIFT